MKRPSIQDALDYCLLNPDRLSTEELLARFPEYHEQLQPLLTVAHDIRRHGYAPPVPVERRAAIKQRVLEAAARQAAQPSVAHGNGRARPALPVEDGAPTAGRKGGSFTFPGLKWPRLQLPRLQLPAWGVAGALVAILAILWWAAASSLPDNPLYNVKLASENLQLALAVNPADKVRIHADIATSRLRDLATMQAQGKLEQAGPALESFNRHLDAGLAVWEETTGEERVELAKVLYTSGEASKLTFEKLDDNIALLPSDVRQEIQEAVTSVAFVSVATTLALEAANIDPSTLPVPTIEAPAVAGTTPRATSGPLRIPSALPATVVAAATETSVIAVARTAVAAGSSANPAAAVAARTVLAGGNTTQVASARQTMVSAASPGASRTPGITPTQVVAAVPSTPTRERPVPPVRTNTPRPSHTPPAQATARRPPDDTPTTIVSAPTRTYTAVPPITTPEPTSTSTHVPIDTPHPTYTSTPSATASTTTTTTATPVPVVTVCDLEVSSVDASCASEDCIDWSARVYNSGGGTTDAYWTAELQISRGSGGFETLAVETGSGAFSSGETTLDGAICYPLPPNTTRIKVRVSLESPGFACVPLGTSGAIDACNNVPATREPRPTREPRETSTPRPRNTRAPQETPTPYPSD